MLFDGIRDVLLQDASKHRTALELLSKLTLPLSLNLLFLSELQRYTIRLTRDNFNLGLHLLLCLVFLVSFTLLSILRVDLNQIRIDRLLLTIWLIWKLLKSPAVSSLLRAALVLNRLRVLVRSFVVIIIFWCNLLLYRVLLLSLLLGISKLVLEVEMLILRRKRFPLSWSFFTIRPVDILTSLFIILIALFV